MCEPTTISIIGLAISGVTSYVSAQNQEEAMQEQYEARSDQIDTRAAMRAQQRAEEGRAERERIQALTVNAGVSGQSTKMAERESFFSQSEDISMIEENAHLQKRAAATGASAKMSQMTSSEEVAVNTGLQIGKTAYAEYGTDPQNDPDTSSMTGNRATGVNVGT